MARTFEDLAPVIHPIYFNRPLRSAEELIAVGADIMATYQDAELTTDEVIERMLELFESPVAIEALERELERRASGRDADNWH